MLRAPNDLMSVALAGLLSLSAVILLAITMTITWCVVHHNRLPKAFLPPRRPDEPDMNLLNTPTAAGTLSSTQRQRIIRRFLPLMSIITMTMLALSSIAIAPSAPAAQQQQVTDESTPLTEPVELIPKEVLNKPVKRPTLWDKASEIKHTEKFPATAWHNANNRREEWLASNRSVKAGSNRGYALSLFDDYGWNLKQWGCLDRMWWHESGWSPTGGHPDRAYGIPQAYPGSKMSSEGKDWKSNPETQIDWGLSYIKSRYETPCGAFSAWVDRAEDGIGWY